MTVLFYTLQTAMAGGNLDDIKTKLQQVHPPRSWFKLKKTIDEKAVEPMADAQEQLRDMAGGTMGQLSIHPTQLPTALCQLGGHWLERLP